MIKKRRIHINLSLKTTCFLFLIFFTFYFISAQETVNTPEQSTAIPEPFTLDEWLHLYEEGVIDTDKDLTVEEFYLTEAIFPDEDEIFIDEETLLTEENNLTEDDISSSELASLFTNEDDSLPEDEESFLEEGIAGEYDETVLASSEEDYFDEDLFLFEGNELVLEVPEFEPRSFDDIFPNLTQRQKRTAMGSIGLRNFNSKDDKPVIIPNPDLGIDLLSSVIKKDPSHIIEVLMVVPYEERELDLLDIYNAVGRIGSIKDYPVPYRNEDFFVFTESTRLNNSRNRKSIPDPEPADALPFEETLFLRLKESTVGNLFIRGEILISVYGLTYNMTNFADVRYFLVPVMKAERFSIVLYLEPVKEGILIYCVSGFYIPGFVADRVNLTGPINRRIQVFFEWISDGLTVSYLHRLEQEELLKQEDETEPEDEANSFNY